MNKSYTLIEVLVAVSIFTIVIAAPTGFLVGSLRGQQKALASQKLLDNTSYSLEYISRALRMAKKDKWGECITAKYNYENPSGESSIRFLNYDLLCQEFFLQGDQLYEKKSTNKSANNFGDSIPLTSEDLEITSLKFRLSGESQTDNDQPRVTLFLEIKGGKGQMEELRTLIKIQTTISQRNLDVPY